MPLAVMPWPLVQVTKTGGENVTAAVGGRETYLQLERGVRREVQKVTFVPTQQKEQRDKRTDGCTEKGNEKIKTMAEEHDLLCWSM